MLAIVVVIMLTGGIILCASIVPILLQFTKFMIYFIRLIDINLELKNKE